MANTTKICRVCGKKYNACRTLSNTGVFRWQDVSCSPECGNIYLAKIIASRTPQPKADITTVDVKIIDDVISDAYGIVDEEDEVEINLDEYFDEI